MRKQYERDIMEKRERKFTKEMFDKIYSRFLNSGEMPESVRIYCHWLPEGKQSDAFFAKNPEYANVSLCIDFADDDFGNEVPSKSYFYNLESKDWEEKHIC